MTGANPNIEVINEHLWSVKFGYLPFISEIEYKPDSEIRAYTEPGCVTTNGIFVLNKDHLAYEILKDYLPKIMKKKTKQLQKELKNALLIPNKTEWEIVYYAMVQIEAERRLIERRWKNGNNKNSNSNN